MARVLIADDEFDGLEAIALLLELSGHEVMRANDGEEALALLQQQVPDVVLTDWMMPRLDGVELCRRIREDLRLATLPVILSSAAARAPDGLGQLYQCFLHKPFDIDDLLQAVVTVAPPGTA